MTTAGLSLYCARQRDGTIFNYEYCIYTCRRYHTKVYVRCCSAAVEQGGKEANGIVQVLLPVDCDKSCTALQRRRRNGRSLFWRMIKGPSGKSKKKK